jgi:hypothetical protein
MKAKPPTLYRLRVGEVYDDLHVHDFVDVLWQAFDKDFLKSLTIELSKPSDRMTMRVLNVKRKRKARKRP